MLREFKTGLYIIIMLANLTGAGTVWFGALLLAAEAYASGAETSAGACSLKETETGCVLENDFLKVTIDKLHGGRITGFIHKGSGKEFTDDIPKGGIMKDMINEAGFGEYFDKFYNIEVIESGPDKVSVKLTGSGSKLPFTRINKTFTIFRDRNDLKVDYDIQNLPEAMAATILTLRHHNVLHVVGDKSNYFIPTSKGIQIIAEGSGQNVWHKDIVRGWAGFIGKKDRVGMVYEVDYPILDYFYNWFGDETTLEPFYKPVKVAEGKSLTTTVWIRPFSGLSRMDGAGQGLVVGLTGLDEKYGKTEKMNFTVELAAARPATLDVETDYRVLPEGGYIPIGHGQFSLRAGATDKTSFSFQPVSEGTLEIRARIREESREILTTSRGVVVGRQTAEFTVKPNEQKSEQVAEGGALKPQELTLEYETPHVKWAKPLPGGGITVLALISGYNGREVVELAQRLDMKFDVALFGGDHTTARHFGHFSDTDSNVWLEKLLKDKDYDVILIGGIKWSAISTGNRAGIIKKLNSGSGLVYICPYDLDANIQAFLPLKEPDDKKYHPYSGSWHMETNHFITAGVPFGLLPDVAGFKFSAPNETLITASGHPVLAVKEVGASRIAAFSYAAGYPFANLPLSGTYKAGLTPTPMHGKELSAGLHYPYWEYYHGLLARTVIWAADRQGHFILSKISEKDGTVTVEGGNTGKDKDNIVIEWNLRDTFYDVIKSGKVETELKTGLNHWEIKLPPDVLPAKRIFDVRIMKTDGVLEFGSAIIEKEPPLRVKKVEAGFTHTGDVVVLSGSIGWESNGSNQFRLNLELVDTYERCVAKEQLELDADAKEMTFKLSFLTPLSRAYKLYIRPFYKDKALEPEWRAFYLALGQEKFDDYRVTVWTTEVQFFTMPEYLRIYQHRKLNNFFSTIQIFNAGWNVVNDLYLSKELQNFLHLYGFEIAVNNLSPTHLDKKLFEETARGYGQTQDKKYLARPLCFHDPAYIKETEERVKKMVSAVSGAEPAYYCFGDEGSLTLWGTPFDFCFCEHTLNAFRQWLAEEYGTIEKLNQAYGSDYRDCSGVVPRTTEEAKKSGNYASWLDHRRFMDKTMVDFYLRIKKTTFDLDPAARFSLSGTPTVHNPYSGYDWNMLLKMVYNNAVLFPYGGLQNEFQRSLVTPGTRFLPHRGYGGVGKGVDYSVWHDAFYFKGAGFNYYCSSIALNEDFTVSRGLSDLWQASADLRRGIGKMLMESEIVHDGVAILYSQDSMRMATILNEDKKFGPNLEGWCGLLHEAGIQYRFVGPDDLGQLARLGFTTLVLPYNLLLTDPEIGRIKEFISGGGTLIADVGTGLYDRHGKPRTPDAMAEIFGIQRPAGEPLSDMIALRKDLFPDVQLRVLLHNNKISAAGAEPLGKAGDSGAIFSRRIGKGGVIFLNFAFDKYPVVMAGPLLNQQHVEFINRLLDYAGVKRSVISRLTGKNGKPAQAVQVFTYKMGDDGGFCLGLLKRIGHQLKDSNLAVQLVKKHHVYDIRKGAYLGFKDVIDAVLPEGEAGCFALLPYKVAEINCQVDKDKINPGEKINYKINLSAEKGNVGEHVIGIEVFDPAGQLKPCYSGHLVMQRGIVAGSFHTALNDGTGTWKIKCTDVASGISQVREIQVGAVSGRLKDSE